MKFFSVSFAPRLLLASLFVFAAAAQVSVEPIPADAQATIDDYMRGFTEAELARFKAANPARPDPPLSPPVERRVRVFGRVFVDANRNGRFDKSEAALPRTLLNDGERVAAAGDDGSYEFSFAIDGEFHHRFVWATRPNGYSPSGPWFGLIQRDDTRTAYEFDFGFIEDPAASASTFRFLTVSDSQFSTPDEALATVKDYAQMTSIAPPLAFLATVGDLTGRGSAFQWDLYDDIRGASKIPVYDTFGGHDGNFREPPSTLRFEERIGPPYYSWNYGGVHFLSFSNEVHYLGERAQRRQEAWIENDLEHVAEGTPIVVIAHVPIETAWFRKQLDAGRNIVLQLAGHWHAAQRSEVLGIPVAYAAPAYGRDWGAFSRAYRVVTISPGEGPSGVRVQSELRVAGQYERLELLSPGKDAVLGPAPLVVLAYDSARDVAAVYLKVSEPAGAHNVELKRATDFTWQGEIDLSKGGQYEVTMRARASDGTTWNRSARISVRAATAQKAKPAGDFLWPLAGDAPRRLANGPQPPLAPLWVRATGGTFVRHSSPVVIDGKVCVAATNLNLRPAPTQVLCYDAASGEEKWSANSPLGDLAGSLAAARGKLYAISSAGWVFAWDASNGELAWKQAIHPDFADGRALANNFTFPVPTERGILVSDKQQPLLLLDFESGKVLQSYHPPETEDWSQFSTFVSAFDGQAFLPLRDHLVGFELNGGKLLWSTVDETKHSSPVIADKDLLLFSVCCSSTRAPIVRGNTVQAFDRASGSLRWETLLPNQNTDFLRYPNSAPVAWDDLVVANGYDFWALDRDSGRPRWLVPSSRDRGDYAHSQRSILHGASTPLVAGDYVFYAHDDGYLRAVDHTGREAWSFRLGLPIQTNLTISGNLLYVYDFAGNLWCFGPVPAA